MKYIYMCEAASQGAGFLLVDRVEAKKHDRHDAEKSQT